MREVHFHEGDAVSCYSDTTVTESDNFNLNTFNNYYSTRNRIVDEGLEIDDYELKIISNNQTRSLKLSNISNFIQMIVSSQDLQEMLGIQRMSLELITVQHLIVYAFSNMGKFYWSRLNTLIRSSYYTWVRNTRLKILQTTEICHW